MENSRRIKTTIGQHKCTVCGKVLRCKSYLESHMMVHTGEKPFQCHICNKSFRLSDGLKKHSITHTDIRFKCTVCDIAYRSEGSLKRHMEKHPGVKPHKCATCSEAFVMEWQLKQHMNKHRKREIPVYRCDVCGKEFRKGAYVKWHMRTHTGEKCYKCEICGKVFTWNCVLQIHRMSHRGVRDFKCSICGKAFLIKDALHRHMRIHTGEKPHRCRYCDRAFSDKYAMRRHMMIHTGEKKYKCGVCGKLFSRRDGIRKHLQTHKGGNTLVPDNANDETTKDSGGPIVFYTEEDLQTDRVFDKVTSHQNGIQMDFQAHSDHTNTLVNCFMNDETLSVRNITEENLEVYTEENILQGDTDDKTYMYTDHDFLSNIHLPTGNNLDNPYSVVPGVKKAVKEKIKIPKNAFNCIVCDKLYSTKDGFQRHMLIHTGGTLDSTCNDSDKISSQNSDINETSKKAKAGGKRFPCDICQKTYSSKSTLKTHIKLHTGDKPYKCENCGKTFVWKCEMQRHALIHTDKVYECSTCGKVYKTEDGLKRHIMRKHPEIKPFPCVTCNERFFDKRQLIKHMKIHWNNKVFQCNVCGTEFSRNANLQKHLKVHKGVRPFKCDICNKAYIWNFQKTKHMKKHTVPRVVKSKIHKCDVCEKTFPRNAFLQNHMRTHIPLGERPIIAMLRNAPPTRQVDKMRNMKKQKKQVDPARPKCHICGQLLHITDNVRNHMMSHSISDQSKHRQNQLQAKSGPVMVSFHVSKNLLPPS